MKPKYYNLNELIGFIEEPNSSICRQFLEDNKDVLKHARGSAHKHQAWNGGYIDHVTDTMNIAVVLYKSLDNLRPLDFSLSDALLVLYLHDLEKPWKYNISKDGSWKENPDLKNKENQIKQFVEQKIKDYGFVLNENHKNGLLYVEGEKNDYSRDKRIQKPLASFVHMCDIWSARGWFDFPNDKNDPWTGAKRGMY